MVHVVREHYQQIHVVMVMSHPRVEPYVLRVQVQMEEPVFREKAYPDIIRCVNWGAIERLLLIVMVDPLPRIVLMVTATWDLSHNLSLLKP